MSLNFECGRYLVAHIGYYVTEVLDIKRVHQAYYAILKGGTQQFRLPVSWQHNHPFEIYPVSHNPYAFEKEPREHTSAELLNLLRLHLDLFDKYSQEETRLFKPLRRFFKIYVRGIRGASELRHQLMSTNTTDEARELLDEFEANMETTIQ